MNGFFPGGVKRTSIDLSYSNHGRDVSSQSIDVSRLCKDASKPKSPKGINKIKEGISDEPHQFRLAQDEPLPPDEAPPSLTRFAQDEQNASNDSHSVPKLSRRESNSDMRTFRDQQRAKIDEELQRLQQENKERQKHKNHPLACGPSQSTIHTSANTGKKYWILTNQANLIFCGVILLNAIYVGVELEFRNPNSSDNLEDPEWFIVESLFLFIFAVELLLRIQALRAEVIRDWWNCFDMALVLMGIIDSWILAIVRSAGKYPSKEVSGSGFQALRLVRLLRVLRVIRIVRFLRELLFLVKGILVSLKALVPSLVLIVLFLYMSALFIHRVLGRTAHEDPDQEEDMDKWFGTVGRSLFTLFQIQTLDAWPLIVRTCMKEFHPMIWLFFVPFLAITHYTLLNLVTAVVVENVLVISQQEQMKEVNNNEQSRFQNIRKLKQLFEDMDEDGNGELSLEEFQVAMKDDNVLKQFNQLEIASYEALDLFELLDIDHDGAISVSEFVEGCLRVRGAAKSKHLLAVQYDLQRFWHDMRELLEDVQVVMDPELEGPEKGSEPTSPSTPGIRRKSTDSDAGNELPLGKIKTNDSKGSNHSFPSRKGSNEISGENRRASLSEVIAKSQTRKDPNKYGSDDSGISDPASPAGPFNKRLSLKSLGGGEGGELGLNPSTSLSFAMGGQGINPTIAARLQDEATFGRRRSRESGEIPEVFGKRKSRDSGTDKELQRRSLNVSQTADPTLFAPRRSLQVNSLASEASTHAHSGTQKRASLGTLLAQRKEAEKEDKEVVEKKKEEAGEIQGTVKQGFQRLQEAVQSVAGGQREINEMLKSKLDRMQQSLASISEFSG